MKKYSFCISLIICLLVGNVSVSLNKKENKKRIEFQLNSLFKDHMVLQRDMPIPIWGKAEAGTTVTVKFANSEKSTVVDSNGKWRVNLDALNANFESRTMLITSSINKDVIKISDIVVGDVWICSGQSNMQMGVGGVPEIKALIPTSSNIRSFKVKNTVAFQPQETCDGEWVNEHPNSAVAFSFAYFLQKSANVPVGIILTSWGSSSIEAWMPREMTKTVPHFKTMMDEFDADTNTKNRIKTILEGVKPWARKDDIFLRRQSNILYNAMMHPLIPYACSGLVWYQGERNTQSMHGMPKKPWFSRNSGMLKYGETLKEWVKNYRKSWNNDDMHFMVVMLPGYGKILDSGTDINLESPDSHSWAWMRESQLKVLELPNTSVVNTIDLGHVKNIHPKDKLPIGKRLASLAMNAVLKSGTESYGPIFKKIKTKKNTLVIYFDHAKELKTKDGKAPKAFWLSDDSKKWFPADAKIKGKTIILSTSGLEKPLYVRYAFTGKPTVNLVNGVDLPAYPFRTDTFKP
ncbi:sialate O-acetylesterase [Flavivirga jejuensis]|uniref:Sialate O-acetylesterase n=1 Tax=Flavivirga jejuensis TaxID=870487 RepID=A0ABT8WSL5_9FLAO|nr:sialate O-acetylesterase [Flavivirga jejuensis]MDO5976187.1 sialate O-acetylesterase [Flavivirga jejuensis]